MSGVNAHGTEIQLGSVGTSGSALDPAPTATEAGTPTIVNCVGHELMDGQAVLISGVTGAGATVANGTWSIDVITEDVFTIPVTTTGAGGGTIVCTPAARTYTPIAGCKDITLPSAATDEIDITTHDSLGKEFMEGDTDYGEVGFDINYDPTEPTHVTLRELSQAVPKVTRQWNAVMTDTGTETWAFAGWVKTFTLSAPVSGVYTATVAIRVTGAPSVG